MSFRHTAMIAILATAVISACAKQPEDIAAIEVNSSTYAGYSCRQLSNEKMRISQELMNLSAQQQDAATGDALGVLLIGIPLSSMTGNDKETLIAVAKGNIQAIDRYYAAKNCG